MIDLINEYSYNLSVGAPIGRPFFIQARLGGGIPAASQAKVTGLLMVSTTLSSAGPSILGGTEMRETEVSLHETVLQCLKTYEQMSCMNEWIRIYNVLP